MAAFSAPWISRGEILDRLGVGRLAGAGRPDVDLEALEQARRGAARDDAGR